MANRESQQRRIKISHVAVSHTTKALSEKLRKTFTYELVPENLSATMVYPAGVQGRAGGEGDDFAEGRRIRMGPGERDRFVIPKQITRLFAVASFHA